MKSILKVAGLAGLLALSGQATASSINVGGVVWDPDSPPAGADKDFTARFSFNQWFTAGADAVGAGVNAAPDATKAIDPAAVAAGDVLQGVGEVFSLNGSTIDTSSTTGGAAGSFCPGCELTFVFGGFAANGAGGLSNGWLKLYVDNSADFDSAAFPYDDTDAADGNLWLSLEVISGSVNSYDTTFQSTSMYDYFKVVGGAAAGNFDTNSLKFGSDLLSSISASFFGGDKIATATGQINGNSIPEPASLALLGVGLLGMGAAARRRAG